MKQGDLHAALRRLGDEAARAQDDALARRSADEAQAHFARALEAHRRRGGAPAERSRGWRTAGLALAAAAVVLLAGKAWRSPLHHGQSSTVSEIGPDPARVAPPASAAVGQTTEAEAPETPPPPVVAHAAPPPAPPAPPGWRELAAHGDDRAALARALPAFDDECQRASASDLMKLADLARAGADAAHERAAWLAVRSRFPRTEQATTAAFLLGRGAFDEATFTEAARWFRAVVAEAPEGALAQDAAGRLIEAEQRAGNDDGARQAAQRYLQRYPSGPAAGLALRVLGQ
jgi:TolA-binding protein